MKKIIIVTLILSLLASLILGCNSYYITGITTALFSSIFCFPEDFEFSFTAGLIGLVSAATVFILMFGYGYISIIFKHIGVSLVASLAVEILILKSSSLLEKTRKNREFKKVMQTSYF